MLMKTEKIEGYVINGFKVLKDDNKYLIIKNAAIQNVCNNELEAKGVLFDLITGGKIAKSGTKRSLGSSGGNKSKAVREYIANKKVGDIISNVEIKKETGNPNPRIEMKKLIDAGILEEVEGQRATYKKLKMESEGTTEKAPAKKTRKKRTAKKSKSK